MQAGLDRKWSPRQISEWLVLDFPDLPEMRVSHETICMCRAGCVAPGLTSALRTGRALRMPQRVWTEAATYVSPPEVAPHVSGGAVDLTLCTADGLELPMGTEVNETPPEYGPECFTASGAIDAEARANRKTLIEAMSVSGFVNYPSEWWHWSYGDRYWALVTETAHAPYGPATLPAAR